MACVTSAYWTPFAMFCKKERTNVAPIGRDCGCMKLLARIAYAGVFVAFAVVVGITLMGVFR